jgi:ABC-2 type transport system ATP-binding protein
MSEIPPAVSVRHLSKVFKGNLVTGPFMAVKDVSFEVKVGEVYGLIGPNGSGKSTTMKVILGLLAPTKGDSSIFGKSSTDVTSRRDVGFLPENPYFYKHLTGLETLLFYGRLSGLSGANRRVGGYSKGMLQRLGLAQALVHDPRLLVLDEPTAGVDPAGSRKIRDLILEMKQRGLTVLVTSHLLEQMQEVCDRVGIMAHGKMVREGHLDALTAVENQTEITLENASEALLAQIEQLVKDSGSDTRLVSSGKPRNTLERLFLDATEDKS